MTMAYGLWQLHEKMYSIPLVKAAIVMGHSLTNNSTFKQFNTSTI